MTGVVALAESGDLATAITQLQSLAEALDSYQPYHATRADLLALSGQPAESHAVYTRAIAMAASPADAAFLTKRHNRLML